MIIRDYFASVVYNDDDLLTDKPVVTELPKEWYDPAEDEELQAQRPPAAYLV